MTTSNVPYRWTTRVAALGLGLALGLNACGSSSDSDNGTSNGSGGSAGAAGSAGTSGSGGSAGTAGAGGAGGTGGSGGAILCGDDTCNPGMVCVRESFPASCTNKTDPSDACPDGQTDTQCGGAGFPCCCEPAPAATNTCIVPNAGCTGAPSCDCISCPAGKECISVGSTDSGVFGCDELPAP